MVTPDDSGRLRSLSECSGAGRVDEPTATNAIVGFCRLPETTLATCIVNGAPVGLSLVAGSDLDRCLLRLPATRRTCLDSQSDRRDTGYGDTFGD